jgi:hypothetical protein
VQVRKSANSRKKNVAPTTHIFRPLSILMCVFHPFNSPAHSCSRAKQAQPASPRLCQRLCPYPRARDEPKFSLTFTRVGLSFMLRVAWSGGRALARSGARARAQPALQCTPPRATGFLAREAWGSGSNATYELGPAVSRGHGQPRSFASKQSRRDSVSRSVHSVTLHFLSVLVVTLPSPPQDRPRKTSSQLAIRVSVPFAAGPTPQRQV